MDLKKTKPVVVCLAFLLVTMFAIYHFQNAPSFKSHQKGTILQEVQAVPVEPSIQVFEETFPRQSTLQDVLFRFDFQPQDVHKLIEDTRPVYDLNKVRAGNTLRIETLDRSFRSLRYEISDEEYLLVDYDGADYSPSLNKYEFDVVVEEIYGQLTDSLWSTLKVMGEDDRLVVDLADIFRWDVDFTAIQSGDWFKLIVEKKYRGGDFVKYGRIMAAQFNTGGRDYNGFLFEDPEDGKPRYFDEKGKSLRKAFLKVPFNFNPRISSGFSYSRLHPILKKRRPHLGVDYAAPQGTPVLASGSGSVTFAGWKGGYGKFVTIKHPNGFITSYAHLSRIDLKSGQKVHQGQRVGLVGSTGLATAAHLDYRVQDSRGKFVNPRTQVAWPSDKPVDKRYWSEFTAVRDGFSQRLVAIPETSRGPLASAIAD